MFTRMEIHVVYVFMYGIYMCLCRGHFCIKSVIGMRIFHYDREDCTEGIPLRSLIKSKSHGR